VPIAETAMGTWINDDDSKQQLITIRPETPLFEVLRMFARHRVESLPVIDEDGGCLIDVCDQYELVVSSVNVRHCF
jgi:CBS domain-containing protein